MQHPFTQKYLQVGGLFGAATVLYFWLYAQALGLGFSLLMALFMFLGVATWILVGMCLRRKLLIGLHIGLLMLVLAYALANVVYVPVYQTFLPVTLQWGQQGIPLSFLAQYVQTIPWWLMLASVGYVCAAIWAQRRCRALRFRQTAFCGTVIARHSRFSLGWVALSIVLFQFVGVGSAAWLHWSPPQAWIDQKTRLGDQGIFGYLYNELYELLPLQKRSWVALAQSKEDELPEPPQPQTHQEVIVALMQEEEEEKTLPASLTQPPHIIFYQLESIPSWPSRLDPNPLQHISALANEYGSVEHFVPNSCFTINAEFSTLCSMLTQGTPINETVKEKTFSCLPEILQEEYGYDTHLYHGNEATFWNRDVLGPKWGFEQMHFSPYFRYKETEYAVIDDVLNRVSSSTGPGFHYVIGFTSHSPHSSSYIDHFQVSGMQDVPRYTGSIAQDIVERIELTEEEVRDYLWYVQAIDQTAKRLVDGLKKQGQWENTILVIFGDHPYYNFEGEDESQFYDRFDVPFVFAAPGVTLPTVDHASHIDIAPTVLHVLEGEGYTRPAHFVGQSLFRAQAERTVVNRCWNQMHMASAEGMYSVDWETGFVHSRGAPQMTSTTWRARAARLDEQVGAVLQQADLSETVFFIE